MKIRIGIGYDIHPLESGRPLYLGGIEVPFSKGLVGHSDGDCLIHAVIDALLGALGEDDIGHFFPDTDVKYAGIRSTELLKGIKEILEKYGAIVMNIDSIVVAEEPRLAAHIPRMKKTLGEILSMDPKLLGIKARTNEKMGAIGQGEAMAAYATVLLRLP